MNKSFSILLAIAILYLPTISWAQNGFEYKGQVEIHPLEGEVMYGERVYFYATGARLGHPRKGEKVGMDAVEFVRIIFTDGDTLTVIPMEVPLQHFFTFRKGRAWVKKSWSTEQVNYYVLTEKMMSSKPYESYKTKVLLYYQINGGSVEVAIWDNLKRDLKDDPRSMALIHEERRRISTSYFLIYSGVALASISAILIALQESETPSPELIITAGIGSVMALSGYLVGMKGGAVEEALKVYQGSLVSGESVK